MMLKEIDSICKRNDIQYFIAQGTLLGAKRNEGFLPWDDDADVTMTAENYEKFKEACATQLPDNRVLCAPEIQESCRISIPRYTSLDTTSFHTGQSLHDCAAGEVIDIFVLDPIADGQEALDAYRANACTMHDMANYSGIASNRYDVPYETYRKYAAIREEKGKLAVCQQLDAEKKASFDENGSRYAYRWQGVITCFERSWFAKAVPVMFEGHEFPAPCGTNEYLEHYFGPEWSELPGHIDPAKHNAALSLDFPYTEALEHFEPSQDREALLADMVERKRMVMEHSADSNWLDDEVMRMKAACAALELEKHLAAHREQFDAAREAKDGVTLAALLADYLAVQNDRIFIGRHTFGGYRRYRHPAYIEASDEVFEAALIACTHTKRLNLAKRLLATRTYAGFALTEAMSEVQGQLELFAEAVNEYQYGAYSECLTKAKQLRERDEKVSAYLKLACLSAQKLGEDSPEFKDLFEAGLTQFADDGFYVKMQADYLNATDDAKQAHELYLVAAENSRNGFVLHDIERKTGFCPRWMRESVWGKSYGLPQWDGPEPDGKLPAGRTASFERSLTPQEYLYDLLVELAELCDANGIEYALSESADSALIEHGMYPCKVDDYGIVVARDGIERLTAALEREQTPLRAIESRGEHTARYHGEDSLYLRMGATELGDFNSLYVTIKTIDVKALNSNLSFMQRVLRKLGRLDMQKAFPPIDRRCDKIEQQTFKAIKGVKFAGAKPKAALAVTGNDIVSAAVSATELFKARPIAPDYFEKRREVKEMKASAAATMKRFKRNFKELKCAVQYKQLCHDLLPQKKRILQLNAEGKTEELRAVLAPYKQFTKSFKGCGEMSIDDEIYGVLKGLN